MFTSNYNKPTPTSQPIAGDLNAQTFEGVALSLVDLHRGVLRAGQAIITGRTFRNCRIEGPAVMLALGGVTFDGTDFGYTKGDIRNIVLFPASPNSVIGAIPVQDCIFKNCQFFALGFTGSPEFTDMILALDQRP
jgi:hypothetical protein